MLVIARRTISIVIANPYNGVPEKPLLFGERTNGGARSRHTNRICLPSTADEDDVAISTDFYVRRGNPLVITTVIKRKGILTSGMK